MDGAEGHAALDYGWDDITLPSSARGDIDPPPWVSAVQPGEARSAGTGLLVAVVLAGLAGTLVGLFVLGS